MRGQKRQMMTLRLWAIILCTVLGILLLTLIIFNEEMYKKVAVEAVEITLVLILPVLILGVATLRDVNRLLKRVKEKEEIFHIVSRHSHRTLYSYDLITRAIKPWDGVDTEQDVLKHLYTNRYSDDEVDKSESIMADSRDTVKTFFSWIHGGEAFGEMRMHVRLENGDPRWFDVQFSNIFEKNIPVTAVISIEDITRQHEYELAYLRYVESVENGAEGHMLYAESDLTDDCIEKAGGDIFAGEEKKVCCTHGEFGRFLLQNKFFIEDFLDCRTFFSREGMLDLYRGGQHQFKGEIKAGFYGSGVRWLSVEVVLVEDPFNHHIKALTQMLDVTEQWEEHLSIIQRADYDAMTGLLRRDVGENYIKTELAASDKCGIMMILDLDDLKGINDQLGHDQGDRAIIGMASIIKTHFRKEDILVRVGGDEFIVFLKGAGDNIEIVEQLVVDLIQKLSKVTVGEKGERSIHCSIGCAVERNGSESFDTLFKRADKALYHVKRNGKNNFAFYVPEMERENYEFRSRKVLFEKHIHKLEMSEMKALVDSIMQFHDMVLAINLSSNTYYIMDEVKNGIFADFPAYGELDVFVKTVAAMVPSQELDDFYSHLSRDALLMAYHRGERSILHFLPFSHNGRVRNVECTVILYSNEKGDICDFTMLRWVTV